jgi:hypothetical protein
MSKYVVDLSVLKKNIDSQTMQFGSNTIIFSLSGQTQLTLQRALKLGDSSDAANVAGAGAIKYDAGLQVSDGSSWNTLLTSASLIGYVPNTRTLTINGTAYDLSSDRSWSVGTVIGSGATNRIAWWDSASSISGNGSSWFNGTQLTLGNTGQDTISNSRLYLYKATSDVSTGGYPHVLTLNNYTAGGDNAPSENFQLHNNTLGFNSGVTYSGPINTVNFNTLRFEGSASMVMNTVYFNYNEIYSTNSSGTISNLIANRTKFANAANSGTLGSVFVYYNGNGDLTGFTNKWFLYNADDFVNSDIKGQVRITGTTNQNGLTVATGIKIADNTDSAATAGGGSLRYNSSEIQMSNGVSWQNLVRSASLTSILSNYTLLDGSNTGITTVTSNTTLGSQRDVLVDATSGNITITLPLASSNSGRQYRIKKIDSSSNTVTIARTSSDTIDGATSQVISSQWVSLSPRSNGTNWFLF